MNVSAQSQAMLRPLGIGEIFDRAVTLYVQYAKVFSIIAAFVVVPVAITGYFAQVQEAGNFEQILKQIQHPTAAPSVNPIAPWYFLVIFCSLALTPFMYVAMASALGRIYNSGSADWREAYGVAFRHTGGILLTLLSSIFIYLFVVIGGIVVMGLAFGIAAAVFTVSKVVGAVLFVPAALCGLAYILAIMLTYLAMALAFEAIGIEQVPFARAIGSGFARVFNRQELGKATLICLAFVAVEIVLLMISAMVGAMLLQTHLTIVSSVVQGALSIVTSGFMGVLIAVYYFDVRVRREGLDMQAVIDSMQTQPLA